LKVEASVADAREAEQAGRKAKGKSKKAKVKRGREVK
jgi:hypothetical protein